jgi:tetratricopeptide (TPR) repeat protein
MADIQMKIARTCALLAATLLCGGLSSTKAMAGTCTDSLLVAAEGAVAGCRPPTDEERRRAELAKDCVGKARTIKVEACTKLIESPDIAKSDQALAHFHRAQGQPERHQAVSDLNRAIELDANNARFYRARAAIRNDQYQFGKAAQDLAKATELTADIEQNRTILGDLHSSRGFSLSRAGQYQLAIEAYSEALSRQSKTSLALTYLQRGRAFSVLKNRERAVADFREAIAHAGSDTLTVNLAEYELERLGEPKSGATAQQNAKPPVSVGAVAIKGTERRVALVVANSAYRSASALANPSRDGARVAETLRKIGFETVIAESNLSRESFIKALRSFEDKAAGADWAVMYYAGHGIEVAGVNYLVPVDANLRTDRDVQDEAVSLDRVLSSVERAKKLRLVILDACRDNPFAARMQRAGATRSIGRGLTRIEPEGGSLVAYAAKHGFVALDGDGTNSPFVEALLRHMVTPNLEINKLFRLVRDDVMAATQRQQEPYVYGSLPGDDFFFVRP